MLAPFLTSSLRISSAITISSAEASGLPSAPVAMPGSCLIRSVESRSNAEFSSASEPPRRMIAASLRPVALSVLSKPAAIASSAVNTATTPGEPDDDDQRGRPALGDAADAEPVMASVWLNNMLLSCAAGAAPASGERVDDPQAPRTQRRQQPHGQAHQHDGGDPDQPHPGVELQLRTARRCPSPPSRPARSRPAPARSGRRTGTAQRPPPARSRARCRRRSRASSAPRAPGTRSRTLCAMVLPTTSSSVKNTANRIQRTIRPMSPICLTKLMLKSFSVWVLVSSGEFSNIASTVLLTACGACCRR